MKHVENLVWMDLEFTGLNDDHVIIEVACLITDKHLNVIAEGPHLIIGRTETELANIDEWPLRVHTKTGLLEKVKESDISIQTADRRVVNFISEWTAKNVYHTHIQDGSLDVDKTLSLRKKELDSRLNRGINYDEFSKSWIKKSPPIPVSSF